MKTKFICTECGYRTSKWFGRCASCGAYGTLEEFSEKKEKKPIASANIKPVSEIIISDQIRIRTGEKSIDEVFGGGIVPGSLSLVAGAPGIGKSTMLLQIAKAVADKGKVIYFSAEESVGQVKLRAERLNINCKNLLISDASDTDYIVSIVESKKPVMAIVDSIQTVSSANISAVTGSVNQLRYSTDCFLEAAKKNNIPIVIVGHITKGGLIAGPKLLEHMVDAVLIMEEAGGYKVLRAVKNRFGAIDQTSIMQMGENGLRALERPEGIFLGKAIEAPGIARSLTIKGNQPLAVEIESLVSPYGIGKSTAIGFDTNRLIMLSAIIEKQLMMKILGHDLYLNVTGGVSIDETATDLAVCASIISSIQNKRINTNYVFIGEVGLAGEVRSTKSMERRIASAVRLGFTDIIMPDSELVSSANLHKIKFLNELPDYI